MKVTMSFTSLGLSAEILRAVSERGYTDLLLSGAGHPRRRRGAT